MHTVVNLKCGAKMHRDRSSQRSRITLPRRPSKRWNVGKEEEQEQEQEQEQEEEQEEITKNEYEQQQ